MQRQIQECDLSNYQEVRQDRKYTVFPIKIRYKTSKAVDITGIQDFAPVTVYNNYLYYAPLQDS
jgi:hypothetical protein